MHVIPVLDILRRQVVRGKAGDRDNYCGIVSGLASSSEPLNVARAIRDAFGLNHIYLADLDGILHQQPNFELYQRLIDNDFRLLVDAGVRDLTDAFRVRSSAKGVGVVVGLETCRSPDDLASIATGFLDVTFSLDLQSGLARRSSEACGWRDQPNEIVRQVVQSNVNSILVLDLADVGMGTGGSTDSICRFIRGEFPSVRLIAGGGVRGRDDLSRLNAQGIDAVLVASALHDGRLDRNDVHHT